MKAVKVAWLLFLLLFLGSVLYMVIDSTKRYSSIDLSKSYEEQMEQAKREIEQYVDEKRENRFTRDTIEIRELVERGKIIEWMDDMFGTEMVIQGKIGKAKELDNSIENKEMYDDLKAMRDYAMGKIKVCPMTIEEFQKKYGITPEKTLKGQFNSGDKTKKSTPQPKPSTPQTKKTTKKAPQAKTIYKSEYARASTRMWSGVKLYYGPNKIYVGEILGGNRRYTCPITGSTFRGIKMRMGSGSIQWKNRDAIVDGDWYVRRDDPVLKRMEWYEYKF